MGKTFVLEELLVLLVFLSVSGRATGEGCSFTFGQPEICLSAARPLI